VRGVVGVRQALGSMLHAKGPGRYDLPAAPVAVEGEPVARNPRLRHGERPVGLIVGNQLPAGSSYRGVGKSLESYDR
jgi:hypothetical protein